ncbi:hypothetical protein F4604DRAFT_1595513 [Suillus subluteus]|nr:hypothetical protein F4604DRAFT_1595513 [Suillus subluteus]
MSSEESYESYSTRNPFSAYSNNYFWGITFENAVPLEFPEIAPAGSVSCWCFDLDVPGSAIATVILPGKIVLHLDDLQPIIQDMEEAFSKGAWSVSIDAIINGQSISQVYHFTKIQFFIEVNNFHPKIIYARQLNKYIMTALPISQQRATKFLSSSVTQYIQGFHVTKFPLWKLGCLLGENWVKEDVLNAMAKLLYFQLASASNIIFTHFLFLLMSFLYLYGQKPQVFSQNFTAL